MGTTVHRHNDTDSSLYHYRILSFWANCHHCSAAVAWRHCYIYVTYMYALLHMHCFTICMSYDRFWSWLYNSWHSKDQDAIYITNHLREQCHVISVDWRLTIGYRDKFTGFRHLYGGSRFASRYCTIQQSMFRCSSALFRVSDSRLCGILYLVRVYWVNWFLNGIKFLSTVFYRIWQYWIKTIFNRRCKMQW